MKPIIGCRYEPRSFEVRQSDGTYSCKLPYLGAYELAVQRALTHKGAKAPLTVGWVVALLGCCLLVIAWR